jgi:hypothetical protein
MPCLATLPQVAMATLSFTLMLGTGRGFEPQPEPEHEHVPRCLTVGTIVTPLPDLCPDGSKPYLLTTSRKLGVVEVRITLVRSGGKRLTSLSLFSSTI